MIEQRTQAYGLLILRLTLGALFIAHLFWKFTILPGGVARWSSGLEANGYPWFVQWYVMSAEFAGAIFTGAGCELPVVRENMRSERKLLKQK